MEANDKYRTQQRKRYTNMRSIRDIVMALIILGIGLLMYFGKNIENLKNLFENKDPLMLNIFGGLCLLYGGFRLYRGIKHRY